MTAIERAEALLTAAAPADDSDFFFWYRIGREALAGYIGAIKALEAEEEVGILTKRQEGKEVPDFTEALKARGRADELRGPAITDFERLFSETNGGNCD